MRTSLRYYAVIVLIGTILAVAAFAVYSAFDVGDDEAPSEIGGIENFIAADEVKALPLVPFLDEKGHRLTLEKFRGKVVVLNIWATWCGPCIKEMPTLDRLQRQLEEVGVVVVALSLDSGGPSAVRAFYEEHGIEELEVYVDPTMQAQAGLHVIGMPTTILIDKDGNERGRLVGPAEWDEARAADLVLSAAVPLK